MLMTHLRTPSKIGFDMKYGKKSTKVLNELHPLWQLTLLMVISKNVKDLSLTEGHRTKEKQKEYFDSGASKIDGINKIGYHMTTPSLAVDLVPYPEAYDDDRLFYVLHGLVVSCFADAMRVCAERGVPADLLQNLEIRWGGDWDSDWDFRDQSFNDLQHFELRKKSLMPGGMKGAWGLDQFYNLEPYSVSMFDPIAGILVGMKKLYSHQET